MRKSRYTEEQIIGFIKQAEAGMPMKKRFSKYTPFAGQIVAAAVGYTAPAI